MLRSANAFVIASVSSAIADALVDICNTSRGSRRADLVEARHNRKGHDDGEIYPASKAPMRKGSVGVMWKRGNRGWFDGEGRRRTRTRSVVTSASSGNAVLGKGEYLPSRS